MRTKLKTVLIAGGVLAAAAGGGAAIAGATGEGDREDRGPDRAITGSALDRASQAALKATEAGDEESYYEVEVTRDDGSQVDVQLDKGFRVVGSETDREDGGDG